jgi:hypothetical protein
VTAIILQPAGGPSARQHYVDTIEQPVPLARMRPHLDPADLDHLEQIYGSSPIPVWGVTPGEVLSVTRNGDGGRRWRHPR